MAECVDKLCLVQFRACGLQKAGKLQPLPINTLSFRGSVDPLNLSWQATVQAEGAPGRMVSVPWLQLSHGNV